MKKAKKTLALLLVLVMCVSLFPGSVGAEEEALSESLQTSASATEPETLVETETPAENTTPSEEEQPSENDTSAAEELSADDGTAVPAAEEQPAPAEHVHEFALTIIDPTCTEDGAEVYTCACGYSYSDPIPATGHFYENGICLECGEPDPEFVTEPEEPAEEILAEQTEESDPESSVIPEAIEDPEETEKPEGNQEELTAENNGNPDTEEQNTVTDTDNASEEAVTLENSEGEPETPEDGDNSEDPEDSEEPEEPGETWNTFFNSITCINPLYADIITEDDLLCVSEEQNTFLETEDGENAGESSAEPYYWDNVEDASLALRSDAEKHKETSDVYLTIILADSDEETWNSASQSAAQAIWDGIFLHDFTDPKGGDAITYQWAGWKCSMNATYMENEGGGYTFKAHFLYTMTWYSSAEQEEILDTAVSEILAELNLAGKTEYSAIRSIYDYLCENVTYDYEHVDNSKYYLMYTGYAALVEHKAVCQGISVAFYRLCLEAGIDARILMSKEMGHAWNIVKYGDSYYEIDATWDLDSERSSGQPYMFFMKGRNSWLSTGHAVLGDAFNDPDFASAYPVPNEDVFKVTNLCLPSDAGTNNGSLTVSTDAILAGGTVTAAVYPAEGFIFSKLTVKDADDQEISYNNNEGVLSFVMPSSDVTVSAIFRPDSDQGGLDLASAVAYINGVKVTPEENGKIYADTFKTGDIITVATYTLNDGADPSDPHEQYPSGFKVYTVKDSESFTEVATLSDILTYCGASIRCEEPTGMRIIYGVPNTLYAEKEGIIVSDDLTYKITELGTVATWASSNTVPTLESDGAMHAYAYRSAGEFTYDDDTLNTLVEFGSDSSWETLKSEYHLYANAFTFTNFERTVPDLAVRPYVILTDASGNEITLYGGVVIRSIGYVADQNANEYEVGSVEYNFIWDIIEYVYPEKKREEGPVTVQSGNVFYTLNEKEGTASVTDYTGSDISLTVPGQIEFTDGEETKTYTVTEIADDAFAGNQDLTAIDLPDSIEVIGARAFKGCTSLCSMN